MTSDQSRGADSMVRNLDLERSATKRMLADVLWEAANEHLWEGSSPRLRGEMYSCHAIESAEDRYNGPARRWFESDFGVPYEYGRTLKSLRSQRAKQGARYMLLLLAMHVAEDEGITL